jgi:hypothetical protein
MLLVYKVLLNFFFLPFLPPGELVLGNLYERPMFARANTCNKPPLEIHLIYLFKQQEDLLYFQDMLKHLFYFSQNSIYVIFFYSANNMFFITLPLKLKYQPSCVKVNFLSVTC